MPSHKKEIVDDKKEFSLPEAVTRAIWVVVFAATAIIFILALIEYAGTFGRYLNRALFLLFGFAAWGTPIVLLDVALFEARVKKLSYRVVKLIAIAIFILVVCGLFNVRIPQDQLIGILKRGGGGGYMGLIFSYPLLKLTGFIASFVILIAMGIVSLLLIFETRLFNVGRFFVWITKIVPTQLLFLKVQDLITERFKREPHFVQNIETINERNESVGQQQELLAPEKKMALTKEESGDKTTGERIEKKRAEMTTILQSRYRRHIDIPLDLLEKRGDVPSSGDINANKEKIKQAFENFGISVEMGQTSTGPTVTQYTLKPQEGVKLAQITALANDLSLALAAHPIRIEAPIPGKSLVGIEVPNSVIATVGLRGVLHSKKFRKERTSSLTLGLGKDVSGDSYTADLERMPHLLIAGATGSGKSVAINAVIVSLLYQNSPDELKFIMIDPKRVELASYNGIPHLLTPVIIEAKKTIYALKWAVEEMDRRYIVLSEAGARAIEMFNRNSDSLMPYIVIIIDELADLMSVAAKEVEALIVRLAQMSRAVGIHLVLATQRPSVNVITGLIKANITARIAFATASQTDSRTILDCAGAEKLLGRGDMLFITAELSKPKRLQGVYVSDEEIKRVGLFLREIAEPDYLSEITEKRGTGGGSGAYGSSFGSGFSSNDGDGLLEEARELILKAGKASASYLQRHLRIGYARAARILDLLEAEGVIGPSDGAKPREVLDGNMENSADEEEI